MTELNTYFLNPRLVVEQQINQDDIDRIVKLHEKKEALFLAMDEYSPEKDRFKLFVSVRLLETIEFEMQDAWGFKKDSQWHSHWFQAPHCSCPSNWIMVGEYGWIYDSDCPLHNGRVRNESDS